jgi:colanic acid/amylovoran biosynthesis glycosyltransferase
VREILRQGHEVLIVPRRVPTDAVVSNAPDLQVHSIGEPLISPKILAGAMAEIVCRPLRSLRATATVLLTPDITVLLRNLAVLPKGLWLARLSRKWRADHIHAQWASTMATMAMTAGAVSDIPWSFTAHRGDIVSNNLLAKKQRKAAFVRFISQSGRELARSLGVAGESEKVCVIHMGAALSRRRQERGAVENRAHILCPAHLEPVKGHRYLLEAVYLLKQRGVDCSLTIAGTGVLLDELRGLAASLAINDRVRFAGQIPHDELLKLYETGKVGMVVLPSVDLGGGLHEGIPVALIEAMAYGVPVVSTATGGVPELLHDGAGLMVAAESPPALADAIERLIQDGDLRIRLVEAGQRRVEEEFAVGKVVSLLLDRIEATLTPARRP